MNSKVLKSSKGAIYIAMSAALISVTSWICIPLPGVPLTLQVFSVALIGYLLGAKLGVAAVAVYILLGAVGVPVFAAFNGGIGALTGVTGGFIWGFIPFTILCGALNKTDNTYLPIASGLLGLIICHLLGALQYSFVAKTDFSVALLIVSAPFILKDAVLVVAACYCSRAIKRRMFFS